MAKPPLTLFVAMLGFRPRSLDSKLHAIDRAAWMSPEGSSMMRMSELFTLGLHLPAEYPLAEYGMISNSILIHYTREKGEHGCKLLMVLPLVNLKDNFIMRLRPSFFLSFFFFGIGVFFIL